MGRKGTAWEGRDRKGLWRGGRGMDGRKVRKGKGREEEVGIGGEAGPPGF